MLCPLWQEIVVRETVHEGHGRTLEGIDSKEGHARGAAYSSEVRDLLRASPSERASVPFGPSWFNLRLQRKDEGRGDVKGY